MSDALITTGYALGNVASSVAIVLVNKKVFAAGFHFPITLSFFHFCFTIVFYKLLWACRLFETPRPDLPQFEKFKVALAGVGSIGFMNVSLSLNSVGFYQVTKLTIVPVTLAINYFYYNVSTTNKVKLSLFILLLGVGVATVSDVELRPVGFLFGLLAVLTTAMFQIWQGTKQKEYSVSGTQLQNSVAFWQTTQALLGSVLFESICMDAPPESCDSAAQFLLRAYAGGQSESNAMWFVLFTCFLALAVNWCSFGLIGRTSPITFQVVGHAKTCLVLVGGYVMFPTKAGDTQQFYNNIAGVSVAMLGVVLYGHVKQASSQEKDDCLDAVCPSPISRLLDSNKYSTISPSETDALTKC
mmetsp:Transcript_30892/g.67660  ORF Transcript_30892/g.67660 Transcript_30892/m.67660 type:complete len:356 (-) Transcript_30892:579-1646(-)